jgi:putative phosphoserine phosphatase/1-acylglycerol-3-phosphate O-acyltransferase
MGATTMLRPGSVAEIEASPAGPAVGAIFDFDGTVIAGLSVRHLAEDRLRRNELGAAEIVRGVSAGVNYQLGRSPFHEVLAVGARTWEGRSPCDLEEQARQLFEHKIGDLIYPEVRELVRAHQRRGHTVVLASSATEYQVEPVARHLGIDRVVCNRLTVSDGVLTGGVEQPVVWGEGKAQAVQQLATDHGVGLEQSYFYADGDEDEALMHLVGNPRPINPAPHLAKVAARRGWPVLRFSSRGARGLTARLRYLAGIGAVVPAGAAGLAAGVLRWDKRAGLNLTSDLWLGALLAANGVQVEVSGAANAHSSLPAVFVFNHRNKFDPFIAASVVRRDFTVVAKKELASDPVLGPIGRFADFAFVDRDNPRAATATMREMQAAATRGLSVLIAPEGTRMDTATVGEFKRGAFRLAMAAKIPIVPIVLRNAEQISGLNASTINPGTVQIAVLPPVPVHGWTRRNLDARIDGVRRQFIDTLAAWPGAAAATA